MPGFKRTVVIDCPIEEVFDFSTDLNNASLFLPNVTKVELLTEGGVKAGAKFRETRGVKGKERSAVIEITEHRRPEIYAARAAMLGMSASYTFRFRREGAGTRIDMEAEVRGNLLWKLFLGMMSRVMEKEDGEYLNRVQAAMVRKPAG